MKDESPGPSTPDGNEDGQANVQGQANVSGQANVGLEASIASELSGCSTGLTDAQLADSILLAYDADASIHELIACGGLTVRVAIGLITGVVSLVLDDEEAMPAGLRFEGEGVYVSQSRLGDSSMTMQVRLYEKVGEEYVLAEEDLFDADNYLTGVEVDADASASVDFDIKDPLGTSVDADASVVITYDGAGPWVKLLGLGDPPPNPIELGDVAEIDPDFSNIYVETEIDVHDVRGDTDVHLVMKTDRVALVDLFDDGNLDYQIVTLEASNSELRQTLTMNSWEVAFADHAQLDGAVTFSVEAEAQGSLSYDASLTYENAAYGAVGLSCPE
jgi:hypothetical protein